MEQLPGRAAPEEVEDEGIFDAEDYESAVCFDRLLKELEGRGSAMAATPFVKELRAHADITLRHLSMRDSARESYEDAMNAVRAIARGVVSGEAERLLRNPNSRKLGVYIMCDVYEHLRFIPEDLDPVATPDAIRRALDSMLKQHEGRLKKCIGEDPEESAYILRTFATIARDPNMGIRASRTRGLLSRHAPYILNGLQQSPKEYGELADFAVLFGGTGAAQVVSKTALAEGMRGHFDIHANLYASRYPSSQALAVPVLEAYMRPLNLDTRSFADKWQTGAPTELIKFFTGRNLRAIHGLEATNPGAVAQLTESFGIYDYGRYPLPLLREQFLQRSDAQKPYGIILYPAADHNGAFHQHLDVFAGLRESLRGKYALRVVECATKRDVARRLIDLNRKYGKIGFAVIGGHGAADSISFGAAPDASDQAPFGLRREDLTGSGVRRASGFFVERPPIVLVSCETGQKEGIAQRLSTQFEAVITAPDKSTSVKSITARFDERGGIHLDAEYEDSSERSFVKGQPVL